MSATSISKESLKAIMQSKETVVSKVSAMANTENVTNIDVVSKVESLSSYQSSKLKTHIYRVLKVVLPPVFGILLLLAVWTLISHQTPDLPGPVKTWVSAVELFSHPFYDNGPNDQGIGWNIIASLKRVALGFGLAALVGIPLGFIIGRFEFMSRMAAPVISLLRPVSPLAWLPIGLLVFKTANPAAIWVIFITAIWPMVINTAVGVSKVPQDYMNG